MVTAIAIPQIGSLDAVWPSHVKNKATPKQPRVSELIYFLKFILVKPAIREVTSGSMGKARLIIMEEPPHLLKKDSYSRSSFSEHMRPAVFEFSSLAEKYAVSPASIRPEKLMINPVKRPYFEPIADIIAEAGIGRKRSLIINPIAINQA